MIDIHSHLLYGVDDGSQSPEMSLELMHLAYDQGIRAMLATSHSDYLRHFPTAELKKELEVLRAMAADYLPGFRLGLGAEVLCGFYSMERNLEELAAGRIPTMNGTELVLAEFWPGVSREELCYCLELLRQTGYRPILAHAERYVRAMEAGAPADTLVQINAYSLARERDSRIRSLARELLARQQVTFLGTDCHRTTHRPPSAAEGIAYIREHCSEEYAEAVLTGNAERLLNI